MPQARLDIDEGLAFLCEAAMGEEVGQCFFDIAGAKHTVVGGKNHLLSSEEFPGA